MAVSACRHILSSLCLLIAAAALGGCAALAPNRDRVPDAEPQAAAFAPATADPSSLRETADTLRHTPLTGRVMRVETIEDIRLGPKEVILTFDDGPAGQNTRRILDALDAKGIKATFFMVGEMARNNPALARNVVARGHTVGSHTYGHPNLAAMSHADAVAEIARGERALREAGIPDLPFFRFPYLADTTALRGHLAARGIVVVDVDIDSKDYFRISPVRVATRTMRDLRRRGSGIILFHDLHARTAAMLPTFLNMLEREGYKVVALQPARGNPALVAAAR
ncbi:MAG: polysaccharide deacetylase family protein [Roseitalea sp.]|jgi:peptidoglycan/xylan/chitin deacetylase (PgdA/CDA1 family)|nr:polysaccharide deacetylase family protein [Roseitalea sp.]MBO6722185.1 polysaccharide deacetylase family protein [Roseitalea sp.]MBO6744887.1 polysaccharide deacetylase family protein [Roseitalea sp.]